MYRIQGNDIFYESTELLINILQKNNLLPIKSVNSVVPQGGMGAISHKYIFLIPSFPQND